MFTLCEDTVWI